MSKRTYTVVFRASAVKLSKRYYAESAEDAEKQFYADEVLDDADIEDFDAGEVYRVREGL